MGGRGIHVWERVIGGWTGDTRVGACDWWVGGWRTHVWERVIGGWTGDTSVGACDWWVDGGYVCESV